MDTPTGRHSASRVDGGAVMDQNDYWTHIGLVAVFFASVVGPRLLAPGHTVNSVIFIVGATVLIVIATVARYRTKAGDEPR